MKPLTWNEITKRANEFVNEWSRATSEQSDKQLFWNDFFAIFGIKSNRVGVFEFKAKRASTGNTGWIDYLWEGVVAVEHKSAGKSLADAEGQNLDYLDSLDDKQIPQLLVACDFKRFRLTDLVTRDTVEFPLADLPHNLKRFGPIAGYRKRDFTQQADASVKAAELLAKVYTGLESNGYTEHNLAVFSVRLLFLLFADDTSVWQQGLLQQMIEDRTSEDGSDLGRFLQEVCEVLNTPEGERQKNLDPDLAQFPYVNGGLFAEQLKTPVFDGTGRRDVLTASQFNWSTVSPAIFGSIFQSVKDPVARREFGSHYTTEANIRRLIDPLFMDRLRGEFDDAHNSVGKLTNLQNRLSKLRFLDPAAGSGNFLIISYEALRRLELDILVRLAELRGGTQVSLDATEFSKVTVGQFYAIEIDEFPAKIAQTAMYLVDHLENMRLSAQFGEYLTRFPIKDEAHVTVGNACRLNWNTVIPASDLTYILGNPPFIGRQYRTADQVEDMKAAFGGTTGLAPLDYVTAWYAKAADYMKGNPSIKAGFVSTNSISQGESVSLLWTKLLNDGVHIDYAVRTFRWGNEARNVAKVHVVIIGFSLGDKPTKAPIYTEQTDPATKQVTLIRHEARNISPYLTDGDNSVVRVSRTLLTPGYPAPVYGSMANDGGHLIIESDDYLTFAADPTAAKYVREYVGAEEVFHGKTRWCLWLLHADANDLKHPLIKDRLDKVRAYRLSKTRAATRAAAATPSLFVEIREQTSDYIFVPFVSSELREYIPLVLKPKDAICAAPHWLLPTSDVFLWGLLTSRMYAVWVEAVAGRLEMRLRLSPGTIYNTFPFPTQIPDAARTRVVTAANAVLDARNQHPTATLATLYNPTTMPPNLRKAHNTLDAAVDALYGRKTLTDADRLTVLFAKYNALTNPLGIKSN